MAPVVFRECGRVCETVMRFYGHVYGLCFTSLTLEFILVRTYHSIPFHTVSYASRRALPLFAVVIVFVIM